MLSTLFRQARNSARVTRRGRFFTASRFASSVTKEEVTEKDEVETVVVETKTVTKFEPSTIEQLKSAAISAVGCFAGIGALSTLHYDLASTSDYTIILGSMGATAVLVFGAPAAPFSQPFNVIVGHAVSAACGIAAYQFIAAPMGSPFLALPVAAAASMFSMQMGKCVHPPAGGTALIAVLGSPHIHALGWNLMVPVVVGSVSLAALGLMNNVVGRKYPQ